MDCLARGPGQRYAPPCAAGPSSTGRGASARAAPSCPPAQVARPQLRAQQSNGHFEGAGALTSATATRKALKYMFKSASRRLESGTRQKRNQFSEMGNAATASPAVVDDLLAQLHAAVRHMELAGDLEHFLPDAGSDVGCSLGSAAKQHSMSSMSAAVTPVPPMLDFDEDAFSTMSFNGTGRVLVCQGGKCMRKGAGQVLMAVSALSANSSIEVVPCKCVGKCSEGPAMRLRPEGQPCAVYTSENMRLSQLPAVWAKHFCGPEKQTLNTEACCVECKTDVPHIVLSGAHNHVPTSA